MATAIARVADMFLSQYRVSLPDCRLGREFYQRRPDSTSGGFTAPLLSASQYAATAVGAVAEVPMVLVVLSRIVLLFRLKTVLPAAELTPVAFWVTRLSSRVPVPPLR